MTDVIGCGAEHCKGPGLCNAQNCPYPMEGNMNGYTEEEPKKMRITKPLDYAQPHRRALEALQHEATSIAGDIAVKGVVNEETERREALRSVMIKMPETRTGQIAFLLQKLPVDEFMSIAEGMGCKWDKLLTWAKQEAPIK